MRRTWLRFSREELRVAVRLACDADGAVARARHIPYYYFAARVDRARVERLVAAVKKL